METSTYASGPATADWVGTLAGLEGMEDRQEHGEGTPSISPMFWHMPYSLGFQVSLTAFLMLELVLGFSSNLTVLVLYCSQSNLVDSVSNMVTVNLHVLDVAVCILCVPLTLAVVLLPPGQNLALICCFHEACVTFASIATAINILVISLDRYDISVRPANRLLTTRRAALLLAAVWVTSVAVFFMPFLEVQWSDAEGKEETQQVTPLSLSSQDVSSTAVPAWHNRTVLCVGGQGYHMSTPMYYHLILQVPIFFTTVAVMLFTYSRILRALNIRIGSHMRKSQRFRRRRKRQRKRTTGLAVNEWEEAGGEQCTGDGTKQLNHPPLISSPSPTPTATSPPALSSAAPLVTSDSAAATHLPAPMGVQASVSAIIALRRAVRRHRDRRERQRRVFRMSLIIITTFLGCWAPLSVTNMLILGIGPSDVLVSLRLWFLALAYGTTVSHPLLYAFTRQKLRRALRAKVKKRVVSLLQVDPSPGGTVIHNSWVENRKSSRQLRLEANEGADRRLAEAL
ncbi:probable G-protein coupled receptor 22 [Austrofundulus limnaeus]|uniref:Probable G-protein coupled receptor 22 n=1 Tax=Austrofundulus limnaeus TaxID=52670 RepID=A0A2I4BC25_AUSLI|nr:PREDICTED: probable G-protein coupled receptor 22 [Austrofundulus limnaeus]XP_013865264.1 PREDICTED: probable G-protein coupled receptor 22 [Austrofundulus limnaeus]XP_013865265.1 PREDICTED: probable G-protein coupled receptor 22 [Austrofundulus limnaeus]XP_013865266.1 PREDICTED: probable G-protein coupled receptor 22 [Austrofundulus limnaeus]XP_013865267.1 PREDICTED: probable G-protein coupled receptor 22 [Austrofundulus limnaeus]XP_013865268.1 PREDICTED: probable G-protein coupled recepto